MSKEKKRKILVVDDEPDNASVFTISLEDGGFEVDTFTDPSLALFTFNAGKRYDLLIVDIKMPNMNGFDLYDAVRKIDNKVKAFFLTAFGEGYTEEFGRRFPSSLFSDISFIRKPISMDDLVKKVNEVI
jgi:CheY-like chemotaxis protein